MTAPRGGTYRMANRLANGKLPELLAERRAAGQSWEDISRLLYGELGIEVSSETLRKWGELLTAETEAVA